MRFTFLILALIILAACTKKIEEPPKQGTDRTSIQLSGNLNVVDSFMVQTNGDWTITSTPESVSWIKLSAWSGSGLTKIYLTSVEANTTSVARTVSLLLTPLNSTLESSTIEVTQQAYTFSEWQRLLGGSQWDMLLSAVATADGGFIAIGNTQSSDGDVKSNNGGSDLWVVRLDAAGTVKWEKTYGSTRYEDGSMIIATSNGYAILGLTVLEGATLGTNQIFKIDDNGTLIWQKVFDLGENSGIRTIASVPSGGLICSGTKNDDAFLMRLDEMGDTLWTRKYGTARLDRAFAVDVTNDGGFLAVGNKDYPSSGTTPDYISQDAWVFKVDANGNLLWEKFHGGGSIEWGYKVLTTSDGGAIIESSTESDDLPGYKGFDDILLTKIDSDGNLEWNRAYGSSGFEFCHDLKQMADGNFLFTAQVGNILDGDLQEAFGETDAWVVKVDKSSGEILSNKIYGDSAIDVFIGIAVGEDKIGLFGHSASTTWDFAANHGSLDAWVKAIDLP